MKARVVLVVVLAVAVVLTGAAAAEPAAKQRVAINMKFHASTFVLSPLQPGAVKRDSGTMLGDVANGRCRNVVRDGQKVAVCSGGSTLTGTRGTLTIRTHEEWVDSGNAPCGIGFGTWKVVRGTGHYHGITGGGRSAYEGHCSKWYARHEGFLTVR